MQLEVGEDVVLDDDQFAVLGQAQQAVSGAGGKHGAGRVVQARIGPARCGCTARLRPAPGVPSAARGS
ncbi:hypothetical protein G6F68_020350 [Rhizopus microsporus]|nr:hypothetical protein G6F68_020350 [Rhizopus microsporus]